MSIQAMSVVWKLPLPAKLKFILQAYADHSAADGTRIFPSVAHIAEKTSCSPREVQRQTKWLAEHGYLIHDGKGPHGTNRWRLPDKFPAGPVDPPRRRASARSGRTTPAPPISASTTPASPIRSSTTPASAISTRTTPESPEGVTAASQGGDEIEHQGVTRESPKPSLTIKEPPSRARSSSSDSKPVILAELLHDGPQAPRYANRDRIPADCLPLADAFHDATGMEPRSDKLGEWIQPFKKWKEQGIEPEHVRLASKLAKQKDITVARPLSLDNYVTVAKGQAKLARTSIVDEQRLIRSAVIQILHYGYGLLKNKNYYGSQGLAYEDLAEARPTLVGEWRRITGREPDPSLCPDDPHAFLEHLRQLAIQQNWVDDLRW